eukprot:450758_1
MPNLKHYRSFDKQIISVQPKPKAENVENTVMKPSRGIIDIINDNLYEYYKLQDDYTYYATHYKKKGAEQIKKSNPIGKFKAFCKTKDYDDSEISNRLKKSKYDDLVTFDEKFPVPDSNDLTGSREEFIWKILKVSMKRNLITILYGDQNEFTLLTPANNVVSPNLVEIQSEDCAVFRVLPNCQRHEVPDIICDILEDLGFSFNKHNTEMKSWRHEQSRQFKFPNEKTQLQKDKDRFKNRNRDALTKFYDAISKLHQATKNDFVKIAEEIKLFNQYEIDKLSNELIERLFTDIEKIKEWSC